MANDLSIFEDEYKRHILEQIYAFESIPTGAWQAMLGTSTSRTQYCVKW